MKGASMNVWRHFRELVGDENLLPVAPDGMPAEKSKLSPHNIGKVPSRYDNDGAVWGIKDWANYRATQPEVVKWGRNAQYGVSIITGRPHNGGLIYGLDIDIPDHDMQETVYNVLLGFMPAGFPYRTRGNSPRRLYPVVVKGDPMSKRVLTLGLDAEGKPSAVECLGLGQQFVAAGRHPSGANYEWRDIPFIEEETLPEFFPVLTAEQFALLWAALQNALPVVSSSEARASRPRNLNGAFTTDETADYLDAEGYVFSAGDNGERYLRSPRAHLYTHAQDETDTSLCYFPAGCGGFERGHFVSLHASDADMTDTDWLDEFGVRVNEFEDLEDEEGEEDDTPTFRDRTKAGKVPPTLSNLVMATGSRRVMQGMSFRYDTFTQTVIVMRGKKAIPLDDPFVSRLCVHLNDVWAFADPSSTKMLEAILAVAHRDKFDSLKDWVGSLDWDGVARCASFFSDVWDMPRDDYHLAVGHYFWTAIAGRALVPGIQADMAPVLISAEQGKGKSKALRALTPDPYWFAAIDFGESRTERIRKMRGKCLVELEEMQGMGRREVGEIRSFITEMVDTTRNPYERIAVDLPRRSVFVATTNDETPFNDGAGNRRWLPMEIADDFDPVGVIPYIDQFRGQLWAEAAHLFKKHGVMWERAQVLARPRLNKYESVSDSVESKVMRFLASSTMEGNGKENWCDRLEISNADILDGAFANVGSRERAVAREIGVIMRRLGYQYKEVRRDEGKIRKWVRLNPIKVNARSTVEDFENLH